MMHDNEHTEEPQEIELSIDGVLDLHTFNPREVKELLTHYLTVCRERGILDVRVIHGKGTGALRRTVHSILERLPEVASFKLAGEEAGGWGATIVILKPQEKSSLKADTRRI
jgi:DNA-nicking Smr family endonuclease